MASVLSAIRNTVPINFFNRGLAGKVFEEVKKSGAKVVLKNNTPECVLLSPEEYVQLMDRVNDAQLVDVADKRMSNFDSKTLLSENEMNARLEVAENELSGFDETDIESDDFVKIQVSAQEHEYLKKAAQGNNKTVSQYIREVLFGQKEQK